MTDTTPRAELGTDGTIALSAPADAALTAAQARLLASDLIRLAHSLENQTPVTVASCAHDSQPPAAHGNGDGAVVLAQGLAALPQAMPHIQRFGISSVIDAVTHPRDTWLSPLDADRPEGQRRRICISSTVGVILAAGPHQLVLAVVDPGKLYDQRRQQGSRIPGYRKPAATPANRSPSTLKELLKQAAGHGFVSSQTGSSHCRLTHPDHPGRIVIAASTSSDHRSLLNTIRDIRHTFGIDIRDRPRT